MNSTEDSLLKQTGRRTGRAATAGLECVKPTSHPTGSQGTQHRGQNTRPWRQSSHLYSISGTSRPHKQLDRQLEVAFRNNEIIMEAITRGASRLGLVINQEKTLAPSHFLCYGKVPVFHGSIEPLEGKRYFRVTCVPNDQTPSLGNAISSAATNSLSQNSADLCETLSFTNHVSVAVLS